MIWAVWLGFPVLWCAGNSRAATNFIVEMFWAELWFQSWKLYFLTAAVYLTTCSSSVMLLYEDGLNETAAEAKLNHLVANCSNSKNEKKSPFPSCCTMSECSVRALKTWKFVLTLMKVLNDHCITNSAKIPKKKKKKVNVFFYFYLA